MATTFFDQQTQAQQATNSTRQHTLMADASSRENEKKVAVEKTEFFRSQVPQTQQETMTKEQSNIEQANDLLAATKFMASQFQQLNQVYLNWVAAQGNRYSSLTRKLAEHQDMLGRLIDFTESATKALVQQTSQQTAQARGQQASEDASNVQSGNLRRHGVLAQQNASQQNDQVAQNIRQAVNMFLNNMRTQNAGIVLTEELLELLGLRQPRQQLSHELHDKARDEFLKGNLAQEANNIILKMQAEEEARRKQKMRHHGLNYLAAFGAIYEPGLALVDPVVGAWLSALQTQYTQTFQPKPVSRGPAARPQPPVDDQNS